MTYNELLGALGRSRTQHRTRPRKARQSTYRRASSRLTELRKEKQRQEHLRLKEYPRFKYDADDEKVRALLRDFSNQNVPRFLEDRDVRPGMETLVLKLRLEEHEHIVRKLENLKQGKGIVRQLLSCRAGRPCGLLFAPITRQLVQDKASEKALRLFGDASRENLRFGTIIDVPLRGSADEIVAEASKRIAYFRRIMRNLIARKAERYPWYSDVTILGMAEL